MAYKLFDYVDAQGRNVVKGWASILQKPQRAKLNQLLDKLVKHGDGLYPQMLTGTDIPGIQKLRVHGTVQLRPLLCSGPINQGEEYTLLQGAKEIGDRWSPLGALESAREHKAAVVADPEHRRKEHERVS